MRRSDAAVLAACLAVAVGAQMPKPVPAAAQIIDDNPVATASPTASPTYAPGVAIAVALTAPVSSETAHVGDTFSFTTTQAANLGDLEVPAGTPGHGRLAVAVPAQGDGNGELSLQADSIDLPGGPTIWVNIDTTVSPRGHYARVRSRAIVIPTPVGIIPIISKKSLGDLVLDTATVFRVVTIAPRLAPAPLITAPPPSPTPMPAPTRSAPAPTPAASQTT